jgi:hypothetical protein
VEHCWSFWSSLAPLHLPTGTNIAVPGSSLPYLQVCNTPWPFTGSIEPQYNGGVLGLGPLLAQYRMGLAGTEFRLLTESVNYLVNLLIDQSYTASSDMGFEA